MNKRADEILGIISCLNEFKIYAHIHCEQKQDMLSGDSSSQFLFLPKSGVRGTDSPSDTAHTLPFERKLVQLLIRSTGKNGLNINA